MDKIYIHRGDCVVFADITDFLTFMIDSQLDLTNWKAEFQLCSIVKKYEDISSKVIKIILSAEETSLLKCGTWNGALVLIDANGHRKTITNTIPFEVTNEVVENHYQTIDLTIPESSGVDIKLKVGASTVTSVNGMTGDVYLEIPSIEGLATEKQLEEGLETKQPVGDYALKEEIPSLDGYVKNTDYASSSQAGVVKTSLGNGVHINASLHQLYVVKASDDEINAKTQNYKPIVPNNLDYAVKTGITTNTLELTADEKANAKAWLGYADSTDIMQAIASIPQFKLSIVEELPLAGEKMTLYLVPKEGTDKDVYDEYIWIEQTASFEHLGTTAVDLTDYVKNTDYATSNTGGVLKVASQYNTVISSSGYLTGSAITLDNYDTANVRAFISKGTLDNIKNDFVKRGVTENDIELTDDEKTSARTWLGAVGDTDYASDTKAGVVRMGKYAHGLDVNKSGYITGCVFSLADYTTKQNTLVVCKGTLYNVLTQYSKTVLTTEADYEALETKDANTLYLIEE